MVYRVRGRGTKANADKQVSEHSSQYTCPTCKRPTLTEYERRKGYQCRDCTALEEGPGYY